MVETDAKANQLVEAIAEDERVKAAALLDESGEIDRLEGHAKVFRSGTPVDAEDSGDAEEEDGHEDVFIESVVERYLVVVFEAGADFEPIKAEVDDLLEKLDL